MATVQHPDATLQLDFAEEPGRTTNRRYKMKPCACGTPQTAVDAAVFRKQKLSCLSKIDLSRKGSIDKAITDVVVFINRFDRYFTTSSCSGRICIYEEVLLKQI